MKRLQMQTPRPLASDTVDMENPYETTWSILRALKAEIRELQATLAAEKHIREEEVGTLNHELWHCREELAKEKADRMDDGQRRTETQKDQFTRFGNEVRNDKSILDVQVRDLQHNLEDARRQRVHEVQEMNQRVDGEQATQEKSAHSIDEGCQDLRHLMDSTWSIARNNLTHLASDVKVIGDQLIRVSNAWVGFRRESFSASTPTMLSPTPRSPALMLPKERRSPAHMHSTQPASGACETCVSRERANAVTRLPTTFF